MKFIMINSCVRCCSCSSKGCCRSKRVLHERIYSIKGCLSSKVIFPQRLSSIEGCLPSNVVFLQRPSSIKGTLPSKIVFYQRSPFCKSCLPSKVIFHQRSSSILQRSWWVCKPILVFSSSLKMARISRKSHIASHSKSK